MGDAPQPRIEPVGPYELEPQLLRFRRRLRDAAALRGLVTAGDIASACGLNHKTVYAYLRGTTLPHSVALVRLARSLGVTPGWLLGFDPADEALMLLGRYVPGAQAADGPAEGCGEGERHG